MTRGQEPTRTRPVPVARHVSIEDVAHAADVSTATVSRVLNNPALVAAPTAARVQATIKKLGYKPNLFAKGLMTRKSRVLGIALPDISGEFYSELIRGADAEARRLGYHLLVSSEPRVHNGDDLRPADSLPFGLIDALAVMITEPNEALWRSARDSGLPLVVLDGHVAGEGVDTISIDNTSGTRDAVAHLLSSAPPDRCFFVGGNRENFDTIERSNAFAAALRASGHAPRSDQASFGEYSAMWGEKWAKGNLAAAGLKRIGVLCANDEIAYGVMRTAQDLGLDVPGDVKLIGFDDSRLASLLRPGLTSVRVPAAEAGASAVSTLVRRLETPDAKAQHITLPTTLVIRQSSASR